MLLRLIEENGLSKRKTPVVISFIMSAAESVVKVTLATIKNSFQYATLFTLSKK